MSTVFSLVCFSIYSVNSISEKNSLFRSFIFQWPGLVRIEPFKRVLSVALIFCIRSRSSKMPSDTLSSFVLDSTSVYTSICTIYRGESNGNHFRTSKPSTKEMTHEIQQIGRQCGSMQIIDTLKASTKQEPPAPKYEVATSCTSCDSLNCCLATASEKL